MLHVLQVCLCEASWHFAAQVRVNSYSVVETGQFCKVHGSRIYPESATHSSQERRVSQHHLVVVCQLQPDILLNLHPLVRAGLKQRTIEADCLDKLALRQGIDSLLRVILVGVGRNVVLAFCWFQLLPIA